MNNYFKTLLMHSGSDCRADLNRRPEENILMETPMLRRSGFVLRVRILLLSVVIQCGAPALFSQQTINTRVSAAGWRTRRTPSCRAPKSSLGRSKPISAATHDAPTRKGGFDFLT